MIHPSTSCVHLTMATPRAAAYVLVIALPVVAAFVLFNLYGSRFTAWSDDPVKWGVAGDFFGGIMNPLISWLTLLVVAVSLYYTVAAITLSAEQAAIARKQLGHEIERHQRELEERQTEAEHARLAAKDTRTLEVHRLWMSPEMQTLRADAIDFLRIEVHDHSPEKRRPFGPVRRSSPDPARLRFSRTQAVWEFMADLESLLNQRLLSESLTRSLFLPTMAEWVRLSRRVDLGGPHPDDQLPQEWFETHVVPFLSRFERWQSTSRLGATS